MEIQRRDEGGSHAVFVSQSWHISCNKRGVSLVYSTTNKFESIFSTTGFLLFCGLTDKKRPNVSKLINLHLKRLVFVDICW